MSYLDYLALFFCSFFVVFLLSTQSRNVNQSRYVAAVVTSFGISVSNFMFVRYAARGDMIMFFVSATGGCMGVASSIWFYTHVIERFRKIKEAQ